MLLLAFWAADNGPASAQGCAASTEAAARAQALGSQTQGASQTYLKCFPDGDGAIAVRQHLRTLKETADCAAARASRDPEFVRRFIVENSGSPCAVEQLARLPNMRPRKAFRSYPNAVLRGDRLEHGRVENEAACVRACENRDACKGYSFERDAGACTLWSSTRGRFPRGNTDSGAINDVALTSPRPEAPSIPTPAPTPTPSSPASSTTLGTFRDFQVLDPDYRVISGSSLAACQRACAEDSGCRAFTYQSWDGRCRLKASAGRTDDRSGAVSGIKMMSNSTPPASTRQDGMEILHDQDLPNDGNPSLDYALYREISGDSCRSYCANDRHCRAFTYNTHHRTCFLKSYAGPSVPFPGAISGRKR